MKIFCNRLYELRKQADLTQCQVADMLGIRQPSYIRYEIGTSEPRQEILVKIADIFRVSVDYLLGRAEY
jgi:transcriptional regulator with XRE-family HTH domain